MGNNLYETVKKYHIDVVTKNRSDFYKEVVNSGKVKPLIKELNAL